MRTPGCARLLAVERRVDPLPYLDVYYVTDSEGGRATREELAPVILYDLHIEIDGAVTVFEGEVRTETTYGFEDAVGDRLPLTEASVRSICLAIVDAHDGTSLVDLPADLACG